MEFVRVELDDEIAVVWIDRQDKLNALNPKVIDELGEAFESLRGDDSVRGVLLTGAGKRPDLPILLQQFSWIELGSRIREEEVERLAQGIFPDKAVPEIEPPTGPRLSRRWAAFAAALAALLSLAGGRLVRSRHRWTSLVNSKSCERSPAAHRRACQRRHSGRATPSGEPRGRKNRSSPTVANRLFPTGHPPKSGVGAGPRDTRPRLLPAPAPVR